MAVIVAGKESTPFLLMHPNAPTPSSAPRPDENKEALISRAEVCAVPWATFCGLDFSRGQDTALEDAGQGCEPCNVPTLPVLLLAKESPPLSVSPRGVSPHPSGQ